MRGHPVELDERKESDSMTKTRKVEILERLKLQCTTRPEGISSDVLELAKYIITKCTINDRPVTNDQLQHYLYLLQKETLTHISMPIHHGVFEAWDRGPVIPDVFNHFLPKGYIRDLCPNTGSIPSKLFVDAIIEDVQLRRITELEHSVKQIGGAWHYTWNKHKGENKEIPLYLIRAKG